MKREEKGWRELMEKAAGDDRLYNLLEDRAGRWERAPTPCQTRRAVRAVTGPLHRMWQLTGTQIAVATIHPVNKLEGFKGGC
jgi:hypothetical protein